MPDGSTLLLFAGASLALLAVPGPAVIYVVTRSVDQGRAAGLVSVLGVETGTFAYALAAAAGLTGLIAASETGFTILRYAGAAYLVYLGVRKLLERDGEMRVDRVREPLRRAFVRGAVVNILNPKTALFFLAFLPQFVEPDRGGVWSQALVLGFIFVGLGLVTDSLYALAAGTVGGLLRRRRNAVRYGSGIVFVALGATAALAKRTST